MAVVDPHYLWAFGHLVMLLSAGQSRPPVLLSATSHPLCLSQNPSQPILSQGVRTRLTHPAYIILRTVLFRPLPAYTYRAAYTGALLSYTIVVLKSLGSPRPDRAWLARAFADENVQYMVLAVYW